MRRSGTPTTRFFSTPLRQGSVPPLLKRAIAAKKHIYCEKPWLPPSGRRSDSVARRNMQAFGTEWCRNKLWLPGLLKIKALRDAGFFGRILSVRGESATGCSRAMSSPRSGLHGTTAERTAADHPRHAVPLALRPRQPIWRSEEVCCLVPPTFPRVGTKPGGNTRRQRTTPLTLPSALRAG